MYRLDTRFIGYPPVQTIVAAAAVAAQQAAGNFPTVGVIYEAVDNVFGGGGLVFARANGAIRQYGLCILTPAYDTVSKTFLYNMTEVGNTANLGRAVYVAQGTGAMAAGDYGWFLRHGVTPVNGTASVAASTTFGITAAGQIGANSAGKQILGATSLVPAAGTIAKTGVGVSGDNFIFVPDTAGFFVGGYMSGTGVGTNAVISDIDPLGKWIKVSVVNSAAIAGTVTQTANNSTIFYNIVQLQHAFAQGAIT